MAPDHYDNDSSIHYNLQVAEKGRWNILAVLSLVVCVGIAIYLGVTIWLGGAPWYTPFCFIGILPLIALSVWTVFAKGDDEGTVLRKLEALNEAERRDREQ